MSLLSIHKYLADHYILRRSIIFIVDSHFDSLFFSEKAFHYVKEFYKELNEEDYFGFIPMNSNSQAEILLEKSGKNKHIKQKVLNEWSHQASDFASHTSKTQNTMKHRL